MSIKGIVFTLGLGLLSLNAVPASAQPAGQAIIPCAERTEIIKQLTGKFAEAPISMGLTTGGSILEIFVSKTRTFSVIVTRPTGISCLIATGGNWENLNAALAGLKV